jgi:uncharacterized coiled-coil DUF342 family protein
MTSLISIVLTADVDLVAKLCLSLSERTDSLNEKAVDLEENVEQTRNVINRTSESIRSKDGEWNLLASAMVRSWRDDEKDLYRKSWKPAIIEKESRLADSRPPARLESDPALDTSTAQSRAEKIPPLTRDLEDKVKGLTNRLQSIRDSSRRVLAACEAFRDG